MNTKHLWTWLVALTLGLGGASLGGCEAEDLEPDLPQERTPTNGAAPDTDDPDTAPEME